MNSNNPLENLEIRIIDTQTGKTILSVEQDGKHFRGFVNEKTVDGKNGNSWVVKSATLLVCSWNTCKVCDGAGNLTEKPWATKN